jgi:broad specificity polyphosphatase/5'/3'-nucleotidase SurE
LALKDLLTEVRRVTVLAPNHNYISVTPIRLDLTAHVDQVQAADQVQADMLDTLQEWGLAPC